MSIIEDALAKFIDERITAYMQGGQAQPAAPPPPAPPATLLPTPGASPPVAMPQISAPGNPMTQPFPAGMQGPGNLMGPSAPPTAPPGPPVVTPPGPPTIPSPGPAVSGPPPVTAPTAPAAPVAGVPTLADLRALANDLMRQKPEQATAFQNYMASKGVTSLADMQPADYPETAAKFKELMGVA